MSKKYVYEISINGGKKTGPPLHYNYGQTKDIQLYINSQKALIVFTQSKKKPVEDVITFKIKLVRDALRKVHLIHALRHKRGLDVKKIQVNIDGEGYIFQEETPNFPFLFSMIPNKDMQLSSDWIYAIADIVNVPKTAMDTDHRFCATFSYLASKGRKYRIDKFTNLWTAMNAYGNYIAECYDRDIALSYDLNSVGKSKRSDVLLKGQDTKLVRVLALMEKEDIHFQSSNELKELWENYYGIQNELMKIPAEDYKELYEEARRALDPTYEIAEKFKPLEACAKRFERPLFIFLLIEYPYQLRCNYLHGSFSTILFSAFNDYEIASLGVVNYFLDRYLNKKLPEIFRQEFWDDEKYEKVKACVRIATGFENNGTSKFDNTLAKLALIE